MGGGGRGEQKNTTVFRRSPEACSKPSNAGSHGALVKTSRSSLLSTTVTPDPRSELFVRFFFSFFCFLYLCLCSTLPSHNSSSVFTAPDPSTQPCRSGPGPSTTTNSAHWSGPCLIQHCPSFTTRLLCPPPLRPGRRGRGRGPGAGGAVRLPPGAEKKGAGEVPHTGQTPGRAGPGSGPACRPLSRGDGQPNVQSLKGCIYLLR